MEELFTDHDIYNAYRKLKAYFYYDNTNHFMRRKIAEFEASPIFEDKLTQLKDVLKTRKVDSIIKKYENEIGYYLQPKGFKNNILEEDCESLIVTNRYISEEYELSSFNYFVDLPIELHIVNVLWILKLGYLLDSDYCYYSDNYKSYCYANRLELDENTHQVVPGNKLFKTYAHQYQQWRDNCIEVAEDLLENHKKDVIIVSLDIKRYYPSADLDYKLVNQDLKIRCDNKGLSEEFNKYSFLTNILGKIRDIYFKEIGLIWESEKNSKNQLISERPIPIGMLSSNIIANWYLRTFDERVNKYVKPAFYGRYVDDILIVLENRGGCSELEREDGKCDKTCCSKKRKLTIDKILSQYFCVSKNESCDYNVLIRKPIENNKTCQNCEHNKNKTGNNKKTSENSELDKNKTSENEKCDYFIKINDNLLRIQGNKVKLFIFDSNSTKAMLKKFKETIRKHSSEFRFLPEEDRIQEDFVQETYSIDYNDTINKLRSIDKYQLDRFKISSYLAKQLMLAKYSTDKKYFNTTKKELLYAFSGRMGLELFSFWDKVLTYFVLNKSENAFCDFVRTMLKNIDRIKYPNNDALEDVKNNLKEYLKESIYLALSLNPNFIYEKKQNVSDFKKDFEKLTRETEFQEVFSSNIYNKNITQLTNSLMIKHKYCFMPILNYVKIKEDDNINYIDYTDTNILQQFEFNQLLDINKMKFNPRRFSCEELLLYENYKIIKNLENDESNEFYNIVFSKAIVKAKKNYIDLNLTQYEDTKDFYEKIKAKVSQKFNSIKQDFTKHKKQEQENENESIQNDGINYNKKIILDLDKEDAFMNLSDLKIGLYNTKVTDESITKNIISQQSLSFNELQEYIRFLNLAIQNNKIKCNMVVFPEVCIPYQALGLLSDFSRKHKVAVICGLKHITIKKTVYNCIATILPFSIDHYTDSYINLRVKEWYAPGETKEIKKLGKDIPKKGKDYQLTNNLFCWNDLYFAIYDCFELADVNYRSEFKSNVDMIIACEWNKDIDYFNNIIQSASRDLHCYIVQVNTSQYGDSKVIAPKRTNEMTLLNIKGGENNILIGHINIEELRDFQRKETEYLDEIDKIFKPLPPAFDKNCSRLNNNNKVEEI